MKRIVTAAAVSLLMGAAINVAIAWGCALWSTQQAPGAFVLSSSSAWSSVPLDVRNLVPPAWLITKSHDPWAGVMQIYKVAGGFGVSTQTISIDDMIPGADKGGPDRQVVVVCSGFPLTAMAGTEYIGRVPLSFSGQTYQLPLKVVPTGFVVNSVVYAILAYGTLRAASAARHRLVRRPGHCCRCRYDLAGNTTGLCPECGTPIPEPTP